MGLSRVLLGYVGVMEKKAEITSVVIPYIPYSTPPDPLYRLSLSLVVSSSSKQSKAEKRQAMQQEKLVKELLA